MTGLPISNIHWKCSPRNFTWKLSHLICITKKNNKFISWNGVVDRDIIKCWEHCLTWHSPTSQKTSKLYNVPNAHVGLGIQALKCRMMFLFLSKYCPSTESDLSPTCSMDLLQTFSLHKPVSILHLHSTCCAWQCILKSIGKCCRGCLPVRWPDYLQFRSKAHPIRACEHG